jgi:hypothetical protein
MVPREPAGTWAADDAGPDWSRLTRLLLWGAAAVVAVALAVIAAQTDIGSRRLSAIHSAQGAPKAAPRPAVPTAAQIAPPRFDAEGEVKRLSEGIRMLAADRDRLIARIATLERNLDDVTGTIAREPGPAPASDAPKPAAPPEPPAPLAHTPARPATLAGVVAAALPPVAPEPTSTEVGADIGGAPTMDGLRTLWSVMRANYPQYFDGMRPVVAIREAKPGTVDLRLVVGPLANAVAAARLCATLAGAGLACQPAAFEGQRLALR